MRHSKILMIGCAFAGLAAAIALSSCKSVKPAVTHSDSVWTFSRQTMRDTGIVAPADSAKFTIPLDNIVQAVEVSKLKKDTVIYLGNAFSKQANAKATIADGKLKVDCFCDELELIAHIIDTYNSKTQVKTQTITLPPVQIKYVPWYTRVLAWAGGIGIVALLLTLLAAKFKSKTLI